eukprot:6210413-Pleurochrysis_carterae.AAC.1
MHMLILFTHTLTHARLHQRSRGTRRCPHLQFVHERTHRARRDSWYLRAAEARRSAVQYCTA